RLTDVVSAFRRTSVSVRLKPDTTTERAADRMPYVVSIFRWTDVVSTFRWTYEEAPMQVNPYLSFNGDCEAAFKLYEHCFDGELGQLFRYGGSPMEHLVPTVWSDKVMHGSVTIGGTVIQGADDPPDRYEGPKGFSLAIHIDNAADAERIFAELASGGRVVMPLEQTFWAERFGIVLDRFG